MSKRPSKKPSRSSGISGRYQKKQGKLLIYGFLLVVVVVAMVILNQLPERSSRNRIAPSQTDQASQQNKFTKEGELTLFRSDSTEVIKIDIEIADDDQQRERGLMYRRQLEEDQGMLFIFANEDYRSFWMKSTPLPLDIIFLTANRVIINIHENTTPFSEQSYESELPAQYVLEVNAGFCAQYRLEPGDYLDFTRVY